MESGIINKIMAKLKIHLINYEQAFNNGILSKFAHKMYDELEKHKDVTVTIGNVPNPDATVNHSINYLPYRHTGTINTLMVTHIFDGYKFDSLKEHLETADMGICMSDDTKNSLIERGLDAKKLTTVLPAHDGEPRRCQIVSILTNVYPDGCKRAEMFSELAKTLDNNQWAFRIMGSGWEEILVDLVARGLQCDYFPTFDKTVHKQILDSSDYSLYFGVDEGSMGLLDAKNAGLKLIAPNVGFNIDIGIDYPFETKEELNEIFANLNPNPVKDWTWKRYVDEHLKVWHYLNHVDNEL
jgi:hypothetical protein